MSQFRKTGVYYVSEWGGDSLNNGSDPLTPYAHPDDYPTTGITNKGIVGSGVYTGGLTAQKLLEADGKVIFEMGNRNTALHPRGIHLRWDGYTGGFVQATVRYDSIIQGGTHALRSYNQVWLRNIYYNSQHNQFENGTSRNNIYMAGGWINHGTASFGASNNYYAKDFEIRFGGTNYTTISNSIVNSVMTHNGSSYECKLLQDGSPRPDADPVLIDIINLDPNFYIRGNHACTDEEIGWIDVFAKAVTPNSILLKKTTAEGSIGGVRPAKKIGLAEAGFTITKTGIDDSNPNSWKVAPGVDFAKVRMTGKVSDSLISAQTLDPMIPFNFDGSQPGGSAANNNVPDAWNARTTPDAKGTKPNRFTFEVRSSKLANPGRDNNADWDNDLENNPSIAGQYYLMEYGHPLLFHVLAGVAYGNSAENAIDPTLATIQPFNYRSLDIIITITNNREI